MKNISSAELLNSITAGWSLGNSLDACSAHGLDSETSWFNPRVSKELIDGVCSCGINLIRIPVTWFNHFKGSDCAIDPEWMDRVNEVVDYAYENGVYVMLNTHHENWLYTSDENYPAASKKLKRVWEQLCERFEGYDERLIFEGMNEPRKVGTPIEWNGGDAEARAVVNRLNADFVRTVRRSGGNNAMRHLVTVTYCGCCTPEVMSELEFISGDDKIMQSVHSYRPWFFCAENNGTITFDPSVPEDVRELDETFELMKKFCIDKGCPIIIDEFGTVNRAPMESRLVHLRYFKQKAAEAGIKYIWWDNGFAEEFALFDRKTGKVISEKIVPELVK